MNQHLIDYTVRNITTGDEEDIRVLELTDEEMLEFPDAVREEITGLIAEAGDSYHHETWSVISQHILKLLLPYISDRALYDRDYTAWERKVLGDDDDDVHVELTLTRTQWRAMRDAVSHAADEVHASTGITDGWGPFGELDGYSSNELSLEEADIALAEVADKLQRIEEHRNG